MQRALLDQLKIITEEEQKILDGVAEVDRDLYTSGCDFIVDSAKMFNEGKLITVRTELFSLEYTSENVSLMPSLINTFIMTALSLLIAAPIGIFAAIYLVEYAKKGNKLVQAVPSLSM